MEYFNETNTQTVLEQLARFTAFVHSEDGQSGPISFRDINGFLGSEEGYKSRIAEEARQELNKNGRKKSSFKENLEKEIAERAIKGMRRAGNLVNHNQITDFANRLNPHHKEYRPEGERALYDIYCNPLCSEAEAFENAARAFGKSYDRMSFLFFIKDDSRFLPVSPGHFEKGLASLGINYKLSYQCSWENYQGFISIMEEIRNIMEKILPMQGIPRLIDAHSFVWIIQEDKFINWLPNTEESAQIEEDTESFMLNVVSGSGGRRKATSSVFVRSEKVIRETKRRAHGLCQLCGKPAPFNDKEGKPYLEVHHVTWLSRGGEDSTQNTVALCPNCHKCMHVLDKQEDVEKLKQVLNSQN